MIGLRSASRARLRSTAAALAAGGLLVTSSTETRAFERQWHLGGGAGYSAFINPAGVALHGFGGALHLTYGLSDTINLLAIADVTWHAPTRKLAKDIDGLLLAGGSLGVGYVFDVLQWVPWVGAAFGAYYAAETSTPGARLAASIPFGLDYQVSRSFAVGISGEYRLVFLDATGVGQRFAAFARVEYIWGY